MSAIITFRHSTTGYDTLTGEGVESILSNIESYMAADGPRTVWSGLQAAERGNIFHTSTSVEFVSAEIVGSKDIVLSPATIEEVLTYADESTTSLSSESKSNGNTLFESMSLTGYAVAGVIAALVVGLFVAGRKRERSSAPVSQDEDNKMDSSRRIQLKDLNLNAPSVSDLKQLVKDEDDVLKMMLSRA